MANRMNDEFSRVSSTLMSPAAPRQPFPAPKRGPGARPSTAQRRGLAPAILDRAHAGDPRLAERLKSESAAFVFPDFKT